MKDFVLVNKEKTVINCPEYIFQIDEWRRESDVMLLLHIFFRKFSPKIMQKVFREWKAFRECVVVPVFALENLLDAKWDRFVGLLGFKFHTHVMCTDGLSRRLFIHVRDFPNVRD